jgi:hypothetical protein
MSTPRLNSKHYTGLVDVRFRLTQFYEVLSGHQEGLLTAYVDYPREWPLKNMCSQILVDPVVLGQFEDDEARFNYVRMQILVAQEDLIEALR